MFSFLSNLAATCVPNAHSFFGLPSWYKYLYDAGYVKPDTFNSCVIDPHFIQSGKLNFTSLSLLGLGIIDILLRLAALIAIGFIVYAGFLYITAQGEPDKARKALGTIINALVGLGITVVAAAAVSFIGNHIGG